MVSYPTRPNAWLSAHPTGINGIDNQGINGIVNHMSIYSEQLDNIADEAVLTTEDAYMAGVIPDHIHHTTIGGVCIRCGQAAVNGEAAW